MMCIFSFCREGSSIWVGGGEVSVGEEDGGQGRVRVGSSLLMMCIFSFCREGSSVRVGGGEVSVGEEDGGQGRVRVGSSVEERRLCPGVGEARVETGGSGSGAGDPRLVSKTQGESTTAEVVRTGGMTGGGRRGLVTGRRCCSGGRLGRGGWGAGVITGVGGKRRVKLKHRGGRERREGIGSGLDGRINVFLCLKGVMVGRGRVGSGGKAPGSERSSGVAGGGGSGASSTRRSVEMEDGVRRLP